MKYVLASLVAVGLIGGSQVVTSGQESGHKLTQQPKDALPATHLHVEQRDNEAGGMRLGGEAQQTIYDNKPINHFEY